MALSSAGPLTTLFSPPPGCLSTRTYNGEAIWAPGLKSGQLSPAVLLGATGQAADLLCYPDKFTLNHVYSPGLCPSGWASACEPTNSALVADSATRTVQCCPTGLSCDGIAWCRGDPAREGPVWSIYTDKYGIEGAMMTTSFPTLSVMAKPIFVAFQSSDESMLSAAAAAVDTRPAVTSSASRETGTSSSGGDSLSGGAIAGIAIGSVLAGMLLATIMTFLALRFCLGYRKSSKDGFRADEKTRNHWNELGSQGQVNELHALPRATELPSENADKNGFAELEHTDHHRPKQ